LIPRGREPDLIGPTLPRLEFPPDAGILDRVEPTEPPADGGGVRRTAVPRLLVPGGRVRVRRCVDDWPDVRGGAVDRGGLTDRVDPEDPPEDGGVRRTAEPVRDEPAGGFRVLA